MADYSEQQLIGALRKADAAGDTAAAKAIARRIQSMRQGASGAADFSSVSGKVSSTAPAAPAPLNEEQWQAERDKLAAEDPLKGQGNYGKYLAGLFKSGSDTVRGIGQAATDAAAMGAMNATIGLNALGLKGATGFVGRNIAEPLRQKSAEMQQATAQRRVDEAPITDSAAGMAGNIVGTLGQLVGPGLAARGTAALPAFLPRTVKGNALQGMVLGGIQPVADQGERVVNAGAGTLGGWAGAAIPKVAAGTMRVVGGVAGRPSLSGAQSRAAEMVRGEASSLERLMQPNPSQIPGVQRTLAEETLDPGIARLERLVRGKSNEFQPIDSANNAARMSALQRFAGDDASLREATRARSAASKPLLGEAYLDKGVDVGAVRSFVDEAAKSNATRPSVASAINDVKGALEKAGDDVYSLYGVRKYIGDLLSGKAGGDKSYARAASAELKEIQGVLDENIAAKSPAFAQYLRTFRDDSKPINRMQIGQEMMKSGSAIEDAATGLQVLTPASFARKAGDLDAVAAKATGFKKARAADSLLPEDIATIKAVQDDLSRQSFRATAGSGGNSHTQERLMLQDKIGSSLLGKVPVVGGWVEALNTIGNQRVNTQLARMIAEPEYARTVLAKLNKSERAVVTNALVQIGGRTGASAPALAE